MRLSLWIPLLGLTVLGSSKIAGAAEGFYKDFFLNASAYLDHMSYFPSVDSLGLQWEKLLAEDVPTTRKVIIGDGIDSNGHLLYPDGAPRFRMVFFRGGGSESHGKALGETGRQRIIDFYNHGGSYSGACAGMTIATVNAMAERVETINPDYLGIYPGRVHYTGLHRGHIAFEIPSDSPLRKYATLPEKIPGLFHNGGAYAIKGDDLYWAPGTEILASYATPFDDEDGVLPYGRVFIGKGGLIARKASPASGRLIIFGSHPEGSPDGNTLHLTKAILQYALDGVGAPTVKAALENDRPRNMEDNTRPGYEKIGDRQYHHFTVTVPDQSPYLTLTLKGEPGYSFGLYARKGDFAFQSKATQSAESDHGQNQIMIQNPQPGAWYVGVELRSLPKDSVLPWGDEYSGDTRVLNGIAYTIQASFEQAGTGLTMAHSDRRPEMTLSSAGESACSLDLFLPRDGTFAFKLLSADGRMRVEKKVRLPAGESRLPLALPSGSQGGKAIGILEGEGLSLTRSWAL